MEEHQIDKALEEELKKELAENTPEEEKEEKGSFFNDMMDIIESIISSVFVVLLIFTFICRPVTVDGGSMNPTLEDKDKLIMMTFFCTPEVGDIVIVDNKYGYTFKDDSETELVVNPGIPPAIGEDTKKIIKRVIAVGGQTVDINRETGDVYVDGQLKNESYILEKINQHTVGSFDYPITVPEGYYFVMGDNRNNSTDSRSSSVGFVKADDVIGEAVLRFYPFENIKILE